MNKGEVTKYYIEESHPPIIDPETWEAVQLEMERCRQLREERGIQKLDTGNAFSGKIICSECGHVFRKKTWMSTESKYRKVVWQCNNKYVRRGVKGCSSKHIDDKVLKEAFVTCFNIILENKENFRQK